MSVFWQQIIIGGAVALAALYILVYYIRRKKRQAGCKSCPALKALEERKTGLSKTSSSV